MDREQENFCMREISGVQSLFQSGIVIIYYVLCGISCGGECIWAACVELLDIE